MHCYLSWVPMSSVHMPTCCLYTYIPTCHLHTGLHAVCVHTYLYADGTQAFILSVYIDTYLPLSKQVCMLTVYRPTCGLYTHLHAVCMYIIYTGLHAACLYTVVMSLVGFFTWNTAGSEFTEGLKIKIIFFFPVFNPHLPKFKIASSGVQCPPSYNMALTELCSLKKIENDFFTFPASVRDEPSCQLGISIDRDLHRSGSGFPDPVASLVYRPTCCM